MYYLSIVSLYILSLLYVALFDKPWMHMSVQPLNPIDSSFSCSPWGSLAVLSPIVLYLAPQH